MSKKSVTEKRMEIYLVNEQLGAQLAESKRRETELLKDITRLRNKLAASDGSKNRLIRRIKEALACNEDVLMVYQPEAGSVEEALAAKENVVA